MAEHTIPVLLRLGVTGKQLQTAGQSLIYHQRHDLVLDIVSQGRKHDLAELLGRALDIDPEQLSVELLLINLSIHKERQNGKTRENSDETSRPGHSGRQERQSAEA